MAESSLSLSFDDLVKVVCDYMGWTDYATPTDASQLARATAIVATGLRKFYYPPPIGGAIHEWSFLRPTATVYAWADIAVGTTTVTGVHSAGYTTVTATAASFYSSMVGASLTITSIGTFTITSYTSSTVVVVSGNATCSNKTFSMTATGDYRLPDDFGNLIGPISYATETFRPCIDVTSESRIRKARQNVGSGSNDPVLLAVRPVSMSTASIGQRFELMLWPTPSATTAFSVRYTVLPNTIATGQYPYGGAAHAETIKQACLSVAERELNDETGIHQAEFERCLMASLIFDRRQSPDTLGYCGDGSDFESMPVWRRGDGLVTYSP